MTLFGSHAAELEASGLIFEDSKEISVDFERPKLIPDFRNVLIWPRIKQLVELTREKLLSKVINLARVHPGVQLVCVEHRDDLP